MVRFGGIAVEVARPPLAAGSKTPTEPVTESQHRQT